MADDDKPRTPRKVRVQMNELGRTGLKHFSGTVYEEFLPQLQGLRGMQVYREMRENSAPIGAMFFAIESLLRSVDWSVEPVSEKRKHIEAADFIEECMEDMSHTWEDFVSEILSMLVFGWSYFEIVYKRRKGIKATPVSKFDDGKVGWRKFAIRAQDTLYHWEMDDTGGIKGMWQYPTPSTPYNARSNVTVLIPIEKGLLFRTTSTKGNPEGRSMLRNAYRPWYFSKRIEEIEAIGIERDLAGMPIAKVPIELLATDRTPEQTQTYEYIRDIVTRVKQDEQGGIIWPKVTDEEGNDMYEFDLISAGSAKRFDTGEVIQRYMQQQVMTVLADFILLGHENVGSFALSSDKTEIFAVALGAWLDMIESVINRHAIPRLMEFNTFSTDDGYPQVRHGDIEKPDIQQLGAFLTSIAGAGAPLFPDLVLENRLREMADLPPVDEEEREKLLNEQAMMGAQQNAMGMMLGGAGGPANPMARPKPGGGQPGGGQQGNGLAQQQRPLSPRPDDLNAPVKKDWSDWAEIAKEAKEGNGKRSSGTSALRPRYFDGTRWKPVYGRHHFLKSRE
jgi:hypothetical protein